MAEVGSPPTSIARLRWQCRRGMRELDVLLLRYLDAAYPAAAPQEQRAFVRLLELADPQLLAYLVHGESPADRELAHVIQRLRTFEH